MTTALTCTDGSWVFAAGSTASTESLSLKCTVPEGLSPWQRFWYEYIWIYIISHDVMCPKRLEFSFGIFEQMTDGAKPAMSRNIRSPESRTRKSTAIQIQIHTDSYSTKRPVGEGKPQLRKNMLRLAGSAWMLRQGTQSLTHLALLSHFVSLCVLVQLSMCKCFTFRVLTNV